MSLIVTTGKWGVVGITAEHEPVEDLEIWNVCVLFLFLLLWWRRFILAHSSRIQSFMVGKSWRLELKAAGHMTPTVRKQRARSSCCSLTLAHNRSQPRKAECSQLSSYNQDKTVVPGWSRSCQVNNTNHHSVCVCTHLYFCFRFTVVRKIC